VEVASRPSEMETATWDGLPQPLEHESALLTPPQEGQPGVASGDETPSPHEATRCLTQFLDKVRVMQEPPLIASLPRQRTPVKRPPPIRPRSRQIAAQPLAHISASRRGEVLLNQRLGFTRAQGDTRLSAFWDLVVEPGGCLGRVVPSAQRARVRPLQRGPVGRGGERILVDLFM
jgi:hypothetical protein